jgi:hypothetical protein
MTTRVRRNLAARSGLDSVTPSQFTRRRAMPTRGMNHDQQRNRRNPATTTADDDEAQEVDVTGTNIGNSPQRKGGQVAAESADTDIKDEDSDLDDDVDDEDDAAPIGGRV